jgi:protein-tyrosine phosphatase
MRDRPRLVDALLGSPADGVPTVAASHRAEDTGAPRWVVFRVVAADDTVHILVVCTANQCRSPLAAGVLARRAHVDSLPVAVASAGVAAVEGLTATPPTVAAARALGIDLSAHSSMALEHSMVRWADLVIGLERRHVQEIVVHDPDSFSRTFTLKELVRRGEAVGLRAADQPVDEWLAAVHQGRKARDLLGVSVDDDVTDPTGSAAVDHHTTAAEIDELAAAVLNLLFAEAIP